MKFLTLATIVAAAQAFNLKASSSSEEVNNKYLSPVHEAAGISYFALGDLPYDLKYNTTSESVYFEAADLTFALGLYGPKDVGIGPGVNPSKVTFDQDGTLELGQKLWGCKNYQDPYRYSQHSYLVRYGNGKPNEDCEEITVKKD